MFRDRRFKFNIEDLWWLVFPRLIGTVFEPLKPFKLFYSFFLSPLILSILKFVKMSWREKKEFVIQYTTFTLGMFFNPHLLYQILLHSFGQLLAILGLKGSIPTPDNYKQKTEFSLPIEGFWTVANGGVSKKDSHSWDVVNQRYTSTLL